MPTGNSGRPYQWLAKYYDAFFSPYRGPFDAARDSILARLLPEVESACDLACGTGTTAIAFARKGIETFAVDLSPEMCRCAKAKAKREGVKLRVFRADMRNFHLPHPVGLITCEYDALNHVPRKEDLMRVAHCVSRALRPGGHFFFDVNTRLAFQRHWTSTFGIEQPGVMVIMRNQMDTDNDRAWSDVDWFIQEGKRWRRARERVEEVCWSGIEMRTALADAGFGRIRTWDAYPFFKDNPRMKRGSRIFYLARKA